MIHLLSLAEEFGIEENEKTVFADCGESMLFNKEIFRIGFIEMAKGLRHVLSVLDEKRDKQICKECMLVFRTRRLRPPLIIGISE